MAGRRHTSCQGQPVEILSPGRHNDDAGPDFSAARIRIGSQEWGGNVEIHVNASDWYHHGHDRDRAYDNVILHVVGRDDARPSSPDGREIPQIVIGIPAGFMAAYRQLSRDLAGVRCSAGLSSLPSLVIDDWLETLAVERLHEKARRLLDYHRQLDYSWDQAVFTALARALGFGLNALPFELLAKSLPLKYVYRHSDDLMQIEALLFGQAGMLLPGRYPADTYYASLCGEYAFLSRKYGLVPIVESLWKYARTRPRNFPHRRIALLARAIYSGDNLVSSLDSAAGDPGRLHALFGWTLDGYWSRHSGFGRPMRESETPSPLSADSRRLLMINLAAPYYYARGALSGNPDAADCGYDLLSRLPSERNSLITFWQSMGIPSASALRSQALLQLRRAYCDASRCLDCRWGHRLLRRELTADKPAY